MLKEIGGFDEYFTTGYEDAELGLRAFMEGYKLRHSENAVVFHKGGSTIRKVFNASFAIKEQKNILYTILKLYPAPTLLFLFPLYLLRNLIIIITSLLFFKIRISTIMTKATFHFILSDFRIAIKKRKIINNLNNNFKLIRSFNSVLKYDLIRMKRFLINREKSALESY